MFLYEYSLLNKNTLPVLERAEISLDGMEMKVAVLDKNDQPAGGYRQKAEATLRLTDSKYVSYYFVLVEKFNQITGSFIKIHPFTAASKTPLHRFDELLLGEHVSVYFQIDIGNFAEGDGKIAIKTLLIPSTNISVKGFSSCNLVRHDEQIVTPRKAVWDRYALGIGNRFAGCDEKGELMMGSAVEIPMPVEYLEFTIQKYTPDFQSLLNREIDDEVVFVETTAGVVNTSRVSLINGTGGFRLYPLGFAGKLKLKLGWKYFSGWSEYEITIRE